MTRTENLIDQWLLYMEHNKGRSPKTVGRYRGDLSKLEEFLGGAKLLDATPEDLEAFTGLHLHQLGLSPRTRRTAVAAVRGLYGWLREKGHLADDPSRRLSYPNAGKPLPIPMSLESAERLMMAPDITTFTGIRDAAILALFVGAGPRLSGLAALNESHLQFFRDDRGKERLVVKLREKGRKDRLVPVPDEARLLLRAYLGHPELECIDRSLPDGDRVLFVSVRNRQLSPDKYHGENRRLGSRGIQAMVDRYGASAGVPRGECHPHAARHLYGTELAEEGIDLLIRQALMGHTDPSTTQVYTRLAMRHLTRAADKANPLRKIRTPVTKLAAELNRTAIGS